MSQAERGLFERIKEQVDYRNEGWWPGEVNRICKEFEKRLAEAERDAKAKCAQEFLEQLKSMEKRAGLSEKESNGLMLAYGMLAAIANPLTAPLPELKA